MALYSTKAERSALFSIVGTHVDREQLEQSKREEARKEQAVELRRAASEASQELDKAEGFDLLRPPVCASPALLNAIRWNHGSRYRCGNGTLKRAACWLARAGGTWS